MNLLPDLIKSSCRKAGIIVDFVEQQDWGFPGVENLKSFYFRNVNHSYVFYAFIIEGKFSVIIDKDGKRIRFTFNLDQPLQPDYFDLLLQDHAQLLQILHGRDFEDQPVNWQDMK